MRSVGGGQVELEVPRAPQGETVGFVGLDPGVWWGGGAVRGADSVMKPWGEWAPSWERAEGVREGDTLSQRAGGREVTQTDREGVGGGGPVPWRLRQSRIGDWGENGGAFGQGRSVDGRCRQGFGEAKRKGR